MSPLLVAIVCACINGLLAAMCSNTALTDADRAVITNKHNALRSSLARGTARTNSGNAPGGSNIYKLQWDCAIEASAQAWANQCKFDHSDPARTAQNLGENLATSFMTTTSAQLIESADMWWNEILNYKITRTSVIMTAAVFNTNVGHFTQMAWGSTTKLGCGVKSCGTYRITVCRYSLPGNFFNEPVYQLGAACTRNSDCTTYSGSTCSVSEGLCVQPGFISVQSDTNDCNGSDILLYTTYFNTVIPLSCPTLGIGQCPSPYSFCVFSSSRGNNVCCKRNIGK